MENGISPPTKHTLLLEILTASMLVCSYFNTTHFNFWISIITNIGVSIVIYLMAKKFWAGLFKNTTNNHLRTFLSFITAWAALTAGIIGLLLLSLGFIKLMAYFG